MEPWLIVVIVISSVVAFFLLLSVLNFAIFFYRPNWVKPLLAGDKTSNWIIKKNPQIITIKAKDGLELKAFYIPHEKEERIFIFNHGYTGSPNKDFGAQAETIYNQYNASLLFPIQRAHYLSNGHLVYMGYKEKDDIKLWSQYADDNLNKNQNPIYLWGASMGTHSILISYDAEYPKSVVGIIADCGYTISKDMIKKVSLMAYGIFGYLFYPMMKLFAKILGYSFSKYDTRNSVKQIALPILFVHGKVDSLVPCHMSIENYHAKEAGYRDILLVPNANHIGSFIKAKEEYLLHLNALIDVCENN